MNYEEDIRIDESSLDIEWLDQPTLFMKYAKHSARMRMELDRAKQNLDIARAETDRDIRETPADYGIVKVTEGAIASAILTADKYKEAYQAWLDAKFEADMAQGAVTAFEQRKNALENLVKLNGQQYFAGPKVPRELGWERKAKQDRVNSGIGNGLKRTK